MDIQYVCELYFAKSISNWQELIKVALQSLGFTPKVMSIYVTMDKMFEEVQYDENLLFSILTEEDCPGISITNQFFKKSDNNPWFRFGDTDGEFVSLKWSNVNLDFLLSKNITHLLEMDGFSAGYAFDNNDAWEQSREAKEKCESDFTIYPGQYKYVCGMQFMAAPLMWFGRPFFEIIGKEKLLKFNQTEELSADIVEVKLFDIYESPKKNENRVKQKNFWSFFELDKIVAKFEEDNSINAVQSLNDFLTKMKLQKKRKK